MNIQLTLSQVFDAINYEDLLVLLSIYYAMNDLGVEFEDLEDANLGNLYDLISDNCNSVIDDIDETFNDVREYVEDLKNGGCRNEDYEDDDEDYEEDDEDWDEDFYKLEDTPTREQDTLDKCLEYMRSLGFDTSQLER